MKPNREEPDMTNTNLTATKLDVVEIIEAGQRWTYPRGAWGVRRNDGAWLALAPNLTVPYAPRGGHRAAVEVAETIIIDDRLAWVTL